MKNKTEMNMKYVWLKRWWSFGEGYREWKIEKTEVELISSTDSCWKIKYNGLFDIEREIWIMKDSCNRLEKIK